MSQDAQSTGFRPPAESLPHLLSSPECPPPTERSRRRRVPRRSGTPRRPASSAALGSVSHLPTVTSRCRSQATHRHESEPPDGHANFQASKHAALEAEVSIDLERAPAWETGAATWPPPRWRPDGSLAPVPLQNSRRRRSRRLRLLFLGERDRAAVGDGANALWRSARAGRSRRSDR